MARGSQTELDQLGIEVVPLPLGEHGLDLRRPSDPGTLTELVNAQFQDARTIHRRDGHIGALIQDSSAFATSDFTNTRVWSYGHGTVILPAGSSNVENVHYPISVQGKGVFEFNGTTVEWTGDRFIVKVEDGVGLGQHEFWSRGGAEVLPYGIPAYLPVQTDSVPPVLFDGAHIDVCYTETLQAIGCAEGDDGAKLVVIDRANGQVIKEQLVGNGTVSHIRVVNSGGSLLAFWLDADGFQYIVWSGVEWTDGSVISLETTAFDVVPLSGGCQAIWDDEVAGEIPSRGLFLGRFSQANSSDAPHTFSSTAYTGSNVPTATNLKVGVAVSPGGDIAWTWVDNAGELFCFSDAGNLPGETTDITQLGSSNDWDHAGGAIAIAYRGLTRPGGRHSYVVWGTRPAVDEVEIWEQKQALVAGTDPPFQHETIFNAKLLSKGFTVGDEVFAWLYSVNSMTGFLAAGVTTPQICGITDREVIKIRTDTDDLSTLRSVTQDPLSTSKFVWARPYDTGKYFRKGDTLVGDIEFLPALSTAGFGRSTYVASSHVRCWDGQELGDAGFHDYPTVVSATPVNGAGSVDDGEHFLRIYPVRYNNQGERFQGVALTYPEGATGITVAGAEDTINLVLNTIPITNHDDVQFEIYMTPVGSTSFRYAGVVANNKNAATVSFSITASDVELEAAPPDPHAPGVDGLQEMEEFGPTGCEVLITSGDRLWGIRGQVPAGTAQFSKLYEVNEGAGFGDLVNNQIFDASARPLTALVGFSDSAIIAFQEKQFYELLGQGPDNFGQGAFSVPQLRVSDGATNQQGIIALPTGVAFWASDGPRLLLGNLTAINISEPVTSLAKTLTPTGVRADISNQQVVWYTEEGDALLWSYSSGNSRWARWTGVPTAGVSANRLVTPTGEVWTQDSTPRDAGRRFAFKFETGNVRLEQLLQGGIRLMEAGMTGKYLGYHRPKFRIYYNNSPDWYEVIRWNPSDNTALQLGSDFDELTPEEIDALDMVDQTGAYEFMTRVQKQDCSFVRVSVSDCGDHGFIPWELTFKIASKGGLGRSAAKTITRT